MLRSIPVLTLMVLLFACGESEADKARKQNLEKIARIKALEDSVFQSLAFDSRSAQALLDVYKAYATANALDSMAPEYLFRAASVAKSMRDPEQSIFLLDRITKDYPSWKRLPETYFLKAFIYDQDMDDKGRAMVAYEYVVNNYQGHRMAEQAQAMKDNLFMTDEEWLERAKRMEQEGAPAAD